MSDWEQDPTAFRDSPRMILKDSEFYCDACNLTHKSIFVQRMGNKAKRYYAYRGPHMIGVAGSFEGAKELL